MNTFTSVPATPSLILAPPPDAGAPEQGPRGSARSVAQLANLFRRRWRLILASGVCTTLLAGTAGILIPPVYTARAQLVIAPPPAPAGARAERVDDSAMAIETEVSAVGSRESLARVFDILADDEAFQAAKFGQIGRLHRLARGFADLERRLLPGDRAEAAEGAGDPDQPAREFVIDDLERNLKVASEPRSRVISVRFSATSPSLAATIANTVVDTYLAAQEEQKRASIRQELARLDRQLPKLRAEMEQASAHIRAFRLGHAILDAAAVEQQEQQAVVLKGRTQVARAAVAAVEAERAELTALRQGPQAKRVASPRLAALQDEEQALAAQGPGAEADRRRVRAEIVAEVDRALRPLATELAMAAGRAEAFERQLDEIGTRLRDSQPAADQLRELMRIADAKRQIYDDGLLQQQKLLQNQEQVIVDARVLSAAAAPQKPASASPVLFLPPALVLGLALGAFAAVWRDGQDDTLRDARCLESELRVPCLGLIPRVPRAWNPWTRPSGLRAATLRALFIATLGGEGARQANRIVLVTSSLSGEGGPALARAFALYAASLVPDVILVDLNFGARAVVPPSRAREPSEATFAVPEGMTLTRPVADLPLRVLSVTRRDQDPLAFLIGRDVARLLDRLRERHALVVVDAGALLENPEVQVLGLSADQTLLAVRWGRTPRHCVENALALLRGSGGIGLALRPLGAVLTEVNLKRHRAYRFGDALEAMARRPRSRA